MDSGDDLPSHHARSHEDERPRGSAYRQSGSGYGGRGGGYGSSAAAPIDPFFSQPYEPTGSGEAAWELSATKAGGTLAKPAASASLSPNIRSKKKVAALFGGNG